MGVLRLIDGLESGPMLLPAVDLRPPDLELHQNGTPSFDLAAWRGRAGEAHACMGGDVRQPAQGPLHGRIEVGEPACALLVSDENALGCRVLKPEARIRPSTRLSRASDWGQRSSRADLAADGERDDDQPQPPEGGRSSGTGAPRSSAPPGSGDVVYETWSRSFWCRLVRRQQTVSGTRHRSRVGTRSPQRVSCSPPGRRRPARAARGWSRRQEALVLRCPTRRARAAASRRAEACGLIPKASPGLRRPSISS